MLLLESFDVTLLTNLATNSAPPNTLHCIDMLTLRIIHGKTGPSRILGRDVVPRLRAPTLRGDVLFLFEHKLLVARIGLPAFRLS